MAILDVVVTWVHVLCVVVFLGTMFLGTFVLLPVLKTHLAYEERQRFIINFIPKVRSFMRVFVGLLIVTGVIQLVLIQATRDGSPNMAKMGVLGIKLLFAAVPIVIFAVAPRVLGKASKEGLCCDPDADDPPALMGVLTSTGAALHYAAIAGGWLAVLFAIILTHMD